MISLTFVKSYILTNDLVSPKRHGRSLGRFSVYELFFMKTCLNVFKTIFLNVYYINDLDAVCFVRCLSVTWTAKTGGSMNRAPSS